MLPDPNTDEKATQLVVAANEVKTRALATQVRTPYEYEQVSEFRKTVKAKFNEIEGHRTYLKQPYLEGGRRIDEFFKPALAALKEAEDLAKNRLLGYEAEQRRIAAEEQRRLEEKARKEREALEAKARAEREKADREAAELKRKEDEARAAGDLAQAVQLRHQANKIVEKSEIKAEAIQSKAAQVVVPKVEAYIPPVQGQYSKTVWRARVVDKKLVPEEYKIVDQAMLDKMAQATKGQVPIAGVEFFSEQRMAGRSA